MASRLSIQQAFELGLQRHQAGQLREAEYYYRQILSQHPNHARAMHYLGLIAQQTGHGETGLVLLRQSLAMEPDWAAGQSNLGNALREQGLLDEAVTAYRRAVELQPNYPEALSNLAAALRDTGQLEDAIFACRQAIAMDADCALAHYNLASCLLTAGDFLPGWIEYEWRTRMPDFFCPWQGITQPRWDGSLLQGRTLLLFIEQGLGDGFQAARFIPLVAQRGGRIIIRCHLNQVGLMKRLPGVSQVIVAGDPQPMFDVYAPMMSLPLLLGTTLPTLPRSVPYLQVDPERVEAWRRRLLSSSGLRVGLVWRGKAQPDPLRSMHLSDLKPLVGIAGVQFFSLQLDRLPDEPWADFDGIDLSGELTDFVETGACLLNLDLIITIDSAVAHLAGALGRPTWILLRKSPDWRWMQQRDDSPWYPTMRLYRQTRYKDWTDPVKQVANDLACLVNRPDHNAETAARA